MIINTDMPKVARVIRFREEIKGIEGTICYMRPLTPNYDKDKSDIFDNSMIEWLESFQLKNVKVICSENILFDNQVSILSRIYDGGRPKTELSLICNREYTDEVIDYNEGIKTRMLSLNIFWNTNNTKLLSDINGAVLFDKDKEEYFFDVIKGITSL